MPIYADEGQIEQILMNLVTNAKDAMPKGGQISIRTGIVNLDEGFIESHGYGKVGKYALVMVSDTGEGMDSRREREYLNLSLQQRIKGKAQVLDFRRYGIVKQHDGYIETCH